LFTVDVPDYCKAHPKAILPDPDNCAHYFNCSDATTATITRATMAAGNYRKECHYPDLFDDSIKQCNNFEMGFFLIPCNYISMISKCYWIDRLFISLKYYSFNFSKEISQQFRILVIMDNS
jgi:hypothetical protein